MPKNKTRANNDNKTTRANVDNNATRANNDNNPSQTNNDKNKNKNKNNDKNNDNSTMKPKVTRDNDDNIENKNEREQRLENLARKQQQENWNNAKKNYNVSKYMHYINLAIDQSNEIHHFTFWCYFNSHGNTTRMSNAPGTITLMKKKRKTPVTIAPAKVSLSKMNRKVKYRYKHLLDIHKLQKQCLKIPEVISKGREHNEDSNKKSETETKWSHALMELYLYRLRITVLRHTLA